MYVLQQYQVHKHPHVQFAESLLFIRQNYSLAVARNHKDKKAKLLLMKEILPLHHNERKQIGNEAHDQVHVMRRTVCHTDGICKRAMMMVVEQTPEYSIHQEKQRDEFTKHSCILLHHKIFSGFANDRLTRCLLFQPQ